MWSILWAYSKAVCKWSWPAGSRWPCLSTLEQLTSWGLFHPESLRKDNRQKVAFAAQFLTASTSPPSVFCPKASFSKQKMLLHNQLSQAHTTTKRNSPALSAALCGWYWSLDQSFNCLKTSPIKTIKKSPPSQISAPLYGGTTPVLILVQSRGGNVQSRTW